MDFDEFTGTVQHRFQLPAGENGENWQRLFTIVDAGGWTERGESDSEAVVDECVDTSDE